MRLNPNLLSSAHAFPNNPDDLYAVLNAHGLYNSRHFVLRLSPEVHRKLSKFPDVKFRTNVDFDTAQAMSTYLHETVHWWQHIGSTTGLMLSLIFPAHEHANHNHLLRLLATTGPKKSLRQLSELMPRDGDPDTLAGMATIVVNNQCDLEFFRALITNPTLIYQAINDPYFDCIGHAYVMAYAKILLILGRTFDNDFQFLPDPRPWEATFATLRNAKVAGFFHGSDIKVAPIGAYHIFEGQARFVQLQYLYFASRGQFNWNDARSSGLLEGVYIVAFKYFLRLTQVEWLVSINSPVIGLFLLIRDIACNPGEGFPLPLVTPDTFISDIDPGIRFIFLCRAIPMSCKEVTRTIQKYSRDEYFEVSERLTKSLHLYSPVAVYKELVCWMRESVNFYALSNRHRSFDCDNVNIPIQFLLGHNLAFAEDKLRYPEFFCWPGVSMGGADRSMDVGEIFSRHSARFMDKEDDATVYPVIPAGAMKQSLMTHSRSSTTAM